MSPLSLVTHGAQQNAHHRMMGGPSIGQMPNLVSHEIEQRMMEYIKLLQNSKEAAAPPRKSPSPSLVTFYGHLEYFLIHFISQVLQVQIA